MEINPDHIKEAEQILIGGQEFDAERRRFINSLQTIDLLAVPGSGKTTALLAKLYCIAKNMPLECNSGILVLSHTNKAVEEIEKALKPICPQLFSYPNFVGTIQSFANRFIANQACFELYGSYIRKNDDEISENELISEFYKIGFKSKLNGFIFNQLYSEYSKITSKLLEEKFGINSSEARDQIKKLKSERKLSAKGSCNYEVVKNIPLNDSNSMNSFLRSVHISTIKSFKAQKTSFCLKYNLDLVNRKFKSYSGNLSFDSDSGKELLNYFEEALKKGILRYSDSIALAQYYISLQPDLIEILQKRFKYVFIDEMQDLDLNQIDLVEKLFFTEKSTTVVQRIGDKNQAIYSNSTFAEENIWKTRYEINPIKYPQNLTLNNSHRLTPYIAKLVDGFVLNRDEGYKVIGVSSNTNIKPHLFVYNDEADADKLRNKFIELIVEHNLTQHYKNVKHGFHIVGWTTDKEEQSDKWYLRKLFPEYSKESKQKKEDFDSLRKYVCLYDKDKQTLESIRKSILNGIVRVLRIEGLYFQLEGKKHFRKSNLIQLIKHQGEEYHEKFNLRLFKWCFSIVSLRNYEEVFNEYSDFIKNELVEIVPDFKVLKSFSFIDSSYDFNSIVETGTLKTIRENSKIEVNLSSIHGVKGQTHCATMYVETEYFGYETKKLEVILQKGTTKKTAVYGANPLFYETQNFSHLNKTRSNETLKMMYVGFSRPTHLLCFAVRKQNVENNIMNYKDSGWEIIII